MIEEVIVRAQEIDTGGDEAVRSELGAVEARITRLTRRIHDLTELAGEGSEADRAEVMGRIRMARGERSSAVLEQTRLSQLLSSSAATLTAAQVREALADLPKLLHDGAAGKLGQDVVDRAAAAFRLFVGGRIMVHTESRPGRQRVLAYGTFVPQILGAVKQLLGDHRLIDVPRPPEIRVDLRRLPDCDRLALRVHELIDRDGLSYREAAKILQREGDNVNSGNVWTIYRRYYDMIGQPVPARPYNGGQRRRPRPGA